MLSRLLDPFAFSILHFRGLFCVFYSFDYGCILSCRCWLTSILSIQSQLAYTPLSRSSCNAPRSTVSESIVAGEETIIEIARDKIGLGLSVVGGADTPLGAIVVHEILEHGAAHQDGRLRVGDQIVELNGIDLSTASHEQVTQIGWRFPFCFCVLCSLLG